MSEAEKYSISEQNKAIVRRFIEEIWNQGKLSVADELIAEEHVFHDPQYPGGEGLEALKQYISSFRSAFPDLHFTIEDLLAEGDKVVERWTVTGTQTGDLPDIPATNQYGVVTGINIYRISDGKIAEQWAAWDTLGMLQNLGVVPRAEDG